MYLPDDANNKMNKNNSVEIRNASRPAYSSSIVPLDLKLERANNEEIYVYTRLLAVVTMYF